MAEIKYLLMCSYQGLSTRSFALSCFPPLANHSLRELPQSNLFSRKIDFPRISLILVILITTYISQIYTSTSEYSELQLFEFSFLQNTSSWLY